MEYVQSWFGGVRFSCRGGPAARGGSVPAAGGVRSSCQRGSGPAAGGGSGPLAGGVRSSCRGGSGPAAGGGQVQLPGGGGSASCALLRAVCLLRSRRRTFLLFFGRLNPKCYSKVKKTTFDILLDNESVNYQRSFQMSGFPSTQI